MLDDACEDCGNPLFRYQGEVLCPVCRKRAQEGSEGTTKQAGTGTPDGYDKEKGDMKVDERDTAGNGAGREIGAKEDPDLDDVEENLRVLAERLARDAAERSDDPDAVERRLDALERTLGLLRD